MKQSKLSLDLLQLDLFCSYFILSHMSEAPKRGIYLSRQMVVTYREIG